MARGVQSGMAMTTGKQGDRTLDINTEPVTWENLADRLKQTLVRPDGVFFIAGAPSLDFQDIARVLDEARGAGINRIGLMPRFK
jgi:biopolymer transport protein ExbD